MGNINETGVAEIPRLILTNFGIKDVIKLNDLIYREYQPLRNLSGYDGMKNLISLLKLKSMETWEHSLRVSYYCQIVGCKLNLSYSMINKLSLFAVFHDIGKIDIDNKILNKPGKLNLQEWEMMKKHSQIGYKIATVTEGLSQISRLILYHHEHWDGTGYPKCLSEDGIPYFCRILAITDAFDAMTTDRVYRKAMKKADAISELKNNAGKQFDPEIIKLSIDL